MTAAVIAHDAIRIGRVLDCVKTHVDAHDWLPADALLALLQETTGPGSLIVSYRGLITMLAGWDQAGWLPTEVLRDAAWSIEAEMRGHLTDNLYGEPF
jgi:hypothetical protein